jgi:hypothetical protein
VLIPAAGIVASVWPYVAAARPVDRDHCTCSCWDGLFKGPYAPGAGLSVYFNISFDTLCMLLWAHIYCCLLQRLVWRIASLTLDGRLRWTPIPVLLVSVYSHIYGGWCVWNYINEPQYRHMLRSQLFFCISELCISLGASPRRRICRRLVMLQ